MTTIAIITVMKTVAIIITICFIHIIVLLTIIDIDGDPTSEELHAAMLFGTFLAILFLIKVLLHLPKVIIDILFSACKGFLSLSRKILKF